MSETNCPGREALLAFHTGELPEETAESVITHVSECPACRAALDTFSEADDTVVARLRQPVQEHACLDEPQCQAAVAQAEAAIGKSLSAATRSITGSTTELGYGHQLGEYRLLEKLGQGGMGTVHKALHTRLDRLVALKLLRNDRMTDERAIARFEREMKAVGQLKHPNIVQAHDAREIEDTTVLVMEYVEGLDLAKLVQDVGRLPIADACELARQTALGLQYAHEHGMVHRDIKPSNLMLNSEGQVKILDLGLALLQSGQPAGEEMTGSGQAMGTADYMAPEQASDSHSVDIRADIYSLGCTLYKLLSGHSPFSGRQFKGPFEKMMAHTREAVPPIRDRGPEVPEDLAAVVDRMLAKDPAERPATPAEVADAVEPFCSGCDLVGLLAKTEHGEDSPARTAPPVGATDDFRSSALVGTQPSYASEPQPAPLPARRRWKPLAIAVGLMLLGVGTVFALQIVISIRDKEGRETLVQAPEGSEVTVERDGREMFRLSGEKEKPEAVPAASAIGAPRPKPVPINIEPEPLEFERGEPLSEMSLVTRPTELRGVLSWTIETRGHRGSINAVAYSPDGRLLATAGEDGTVRMWDAPTEKLLRILHGHDDAVAAVAWSPDSRFLASAGLDHSVCVWDAINGRRLRVLRGHEGPVRAVAWSPDGEYILSGGSDKTVRIWDAASGRPCVNFSEEAAVSSVAWSSSGKHVAYGGENKTIAIRDFRTKKLVHAVPHDAAVTSIAFSPDGAMLVGADRSGAVCFWEVASGKRLGEDADSGDAKAKRNDQGVYAVAFSPDGKRVATGGADKRVRVWEADSGYAIFDLKGPEDIVRAVSWSPDGKTIAAGSGASAPSLRLWDAATGAQRQVIPGYPSDKACIAWVAWSPDGQKLAFNDGVHDWCRVFLLRQGTCRPELCGRRLHAFGSWLPDSRFLIGLAESATLSMMDVESGRWVRAFENAPRWSTFDVSRDGSKLAVCRPRSNVARIIEVDSGEVLQTIEGHAEGLRDVAFSPDGETLATVGSDGVGRAWNIASGQLLWEKTFSEGAYRVTSSSEGNRLAFACVRDESICDWSSGKCQKSLTHHDYPCPAGVHAWSPDGRSFASTTAGSAPPSRIRLYVWDVETGRRLWSSEKCPLGLGRSRAQRLSWSPDGRLLAIGAFDHVLRIWEPRTNRLHLAVMLLGENVKTGLAFTDDGYYDAWGDLENAILHVVQTEQGQETLTPEEFTKKYGWKNDAQKVRLVGEPAASAIGAPRPKPVPINIEPEPREWNAGDALSRMALVSEPAPVSGVLSWTIETREHRGSILAVAYSPDGRLLATAGSDGTVRIWDPSSASLLLILHGHDDTVYAVAWSPDSRFLATASEDTTVCLWNATTGQQLRVLRGHEGPVRAVAWSPDGRQILSGSDDKTVKLWEIALPRPRLSVSNSAAVLTVAWSPDGRHVAWAGQDNTIHIRDTKLKRLIHDLPHESSAKSVAFSPDGKVLASAHDSGAVCFWDVDSGKRLDQGAGVPEAKGAPGDRAQCGLAFSPDGKYLASGSADHRVHVWDVEAGLPAFDLKGHSDTVYAVSWSPDGKTIASASGSGDSSLRFWDVDSGTPRQVVRGHQTRSRIRHVAWSPDGSTLALGESTSWFHDANIWFWDANLDKPVRRFKDRPVDRLSWSRDGEFLAAIRTTTYLMDGRSAKTVRALTKQGEHADCLDWSPDGSILAIGYANSNVVRVVDAESSKVVHTLEGHTKTVVDVAFSPDGTTLATCSVDDLMVNLWDLQSGQLLWSCTNVYRERPGRLAWSMDGKKLAVNREWTIGILDPATGKGLKGLSHGRQAPSNKPLLWHRDGTTLVCDNVVWDVDTGQRIQTLDHPSKGRLGSLDNTFSLSWSPNHRLLAVGTFDPVLSIWEPRTGRLHATLMPLSHNEGSGLAFSPEGHYCVVGDVQDPIVYVVQTDQVQETLTPAEFAEKYGWKNDPEKVTLKVEGKGEDAGQAVDSTQQAADESKSQTQPATGASKEE